MSELEGAELDLAVSAIVYPNLRFKVEEGKKHALNYSSNWKLAGPLIEEYGIDIYQELDGSWQSDIMPDKIVYREVGPTPLIAAMRALVASKECDKG